MKAVESWGRLSALPHRVFPIAGEKDYLQLVKEKGAGIPFGMGRSYGDVGLNPHGNLWSTRSLDKFIHFDERTGVLRCEAGVLLRDIQRLFFPRGWSLPVTPGTLWVTVGGAIANDIHGKNHHLWGTFGSHVEQLRLLRSDGEVIVCGPSRSPEWFKASVGGMGLTGFILEAQIKLRRIKHPWLNAQTIPFEGLEDFFKLSEASESQWEHTVAWIDCTQKGRGLFMRANWSQETPSPPPKTQTHGVPFVLPVSLMNRWTLKPLNQLYYLLKKGDGKVKTVYHTDFLYPLDHLSNWNRLYGPHGFYQYQAILSPEYACEALNEMLNIIQRSHQGSCLAVLKTFSSKPAVGLMSFVKPGATLALDFANQGQPTLRLLAQLDEVLREAKGRLYAAKDARMSAQCFEESYPNKDLFLKYRDLKMSSGMSRRLGME